MFENLHFDPFRGEMHPLIVIPSFSVEAFHTYFLPTDESQNFNQNPSDHFWIYQRKQQKQERKKAYLQYS